MTLASNGGSPKGCLHGSIAMHDTSTISPLALALALALARPRLAISSRSFASFPFQPCLCHHPPPSLSFPLDDRSLFVFLFTFFGLLLRAIRVFPIHTFPDRLLSVPTGFRSNQHTNTRFVYMVRGSSVYTLYACPDFCKYHASTLILQSAL